MKQSIFTTKTAFRFLLTIWLTAGLWLTLATSIQANSGVLLYNPTNGATTYGTIYADGHFLTTTYYPAGFFATGWSHIVRANNGLLFFFRQTDGLWATVQADAYGNLTTVQQGYLPIKAAYTEPSLHVVNTSNGILICRYPSPYAINNVDGLRGGLIGQVRSNGFFQVTQQPNFATWTNVLNTPNGVFFLNAKGGLLPSQFAVGRVQPNGTFVQTQGGTLNVADVVTDHVVTAIGNDLLFLPNARTYYGIPLKPQISGRHRVGSINSNAQFVLKSEECSPILAGGNVIPVALGNDLLLYAVKDGSDLFPNPPFSAFTRLVNSGWASVSTFRKASNFLDPACWGKLRIKQEHPEDTFAAGWSHILYTANGTFFYNSDTGAAMLGKFESDGNFTLLHDLPSWLDPGYTQVINVTE